MTRNLGYSLAGLAVAMAVTSCGVGGPAGRSGGAEAGPAGDAGATARAARYTLLTPSLCPVTCNAAIGRGGFADLENEYTFGFEVVDRSDGDTGEFFFTFAGSGYAITPPSLNVQISGTTILISGVAVETIPDDPGPPTLNVTFTSVNNQLTVAGILFDATLNTQFFPGLCQIIR